jgi:uncharacterized membrane protein YoaK (UPF0700 family)
MELADLHRLGSPLQLSTKSAPASRAIAETGNRKPERGERRLPMTEVAPAREVPLPRLVPALLSFVAGYVDIYTFLALFGLFVAQVTGSFVTAGAELVTHDISVTGKALAIVAFLFAAALTAGLIGLVRNQGRAALPWMLGLETALLAVFTALMLISPPFKSAADWLGILTGLFGAMAMGAQSVIVRLLMRGVPQTNVMTGNMTQLGIETTALLLVWRRHARDPNDRENAREFAAVQSRLLIVVAIAIGFLLGAVCGAVSYAQAGLAGSPLAVVIVAALTLWAVRRERQA